MKYFPHYAFAGKKSHQSAVSQEVLRKQDYLSNHRLDNTGCRETGIQAAILSRPAALHTASVLHLPT